MAVVDHEVNSRDGQGPRRRVGALVRLVAWAGLALMIGLAVVGCAQPHPKLSELRDIPEASLHPPGSVRVVRGGADSDYKFGAGENAAVLRDIYATDDDAATVIAYYRTVLADDWTENDRAGTRRTDWAEADAWESRGYLLQVGIDNDDYRARAAKTYPETAGKKTLFEIQLQAAGD